MHRGGSVYPIHPDHSCCRWHYSLPDTVMANVCRALLLALVVANTLFLSLPPVPPGLPPHPCAPPAHPPLLLLPHAAPPGPCPAELHGCGTSHTAAPGRGARCPEQGYRQGKGQLVQHAPLWSSQ
jgi:hypothetical protein